MLLVLLYTFRHNLINIYTREHRAGCGMRGNGRWSLKDLNKTDKQKGQQRMAASDFVKSKVLEKDIQKDLIKELHLHKYRGRPLIDFVYSIPNGGHRSKSTAMQMKREGVKRGVPDLHCFVAVPPYHSLYIEMKTETGDLTPDQKILIPMLREHGHKVVVCRSSAQAVQEIFKYLGGSNDK